MNGRWFPQAGVDVKLILLDDDGDLEREMPSGKIDRLIDRLINRSIVLIDTWKGRCQAGRFTSSASLLSRRHLITEGDATIDVLQEEEEEEEEERRRKEGKGGDADSNATQNENPTTGGLGKNLR